MRATESVGFRRESVQTAGGDYSEYQEIATRLDGLLEELAKSTPPYSDAKAALEFSSDRRKQALSDAFIAIRAQSPEEPAGSAEHRARGSDAYKSTLNQLLRDEINCENAKNYHELLKIRVDVARSRMAVVRAMIEMH